MPIDTAAAEYYREQVRVMSEAMPAAVSITDPDGNVLWVNPFWTRFTGLSFDQTVGGGWQTSAHPEDIEALTLAFRHGRDQGEGFQAEIRLRPADGEWRWTQIRGEPLRNRKGRMEGWITVSTDVHDRRMAADALALEKARYEALARSMATVVFELDADGAHKGPNAALTTFSGLTFEDQKDGGWRKAVHPDDADRVVLEWRQANAEKRPSIVEIRHWHQPSGGYRWVRANTVPLLGADGRIGEWIGTLTDIHDQARADLALRESEERFRLVAENAPVNLWMGDEAGRCVYLNRQQRIFWGVPDDMSGFSWSEMLLDEDREGLFAAYEAAMEAQRSFEVEARYWRHDREVRILRTEANPRRDAEGNFLGMIGVNVDVTDARQAEKRQRLLINELNHRVKNTLATVQSLAFQTLRASPDVTHARHVLDGRLIALSAAHNVLNRESWEAADLAEVVTESLRAYETPGQPRFAVRGPPTRISPPAALAVALVLHELATNAVKYGALSCETGQVELTWTPGAEGLSNLTWRETGGPAVTAPTREGFGSRLLASVASDLGAPAVIDYQAEGLVCRFQAPLAEAETL